MRIMKVNVLLVCLIGLLEFCNAQITVTSAIFPEVGDTLLIAKDNMPENLELFGNGGPYNWDFAALQAPFATNITFSKAEFGSGSHLFPEADLMIRLGAQNTAFFRQRNNKIELLGTYGIDPYGMGIMMPFKYYPAIPEQWAYMRYRDRLDSYGIAKTTISAESLPKQWLDALDLNPDSLRITRKITRNDHVDAYGSIEIPGGGYDVLRMQRTEVIESVIEAKFAIGTWLDITNSVPNAAKVKFQKSRSYYFINDEEKETIAKATVNPSNDVIQTVEFKSLDPSSNRQSIPSHQPSMALYPNPAIIDLRVDFANLKPGTYKLRILNILGVPVMEKELWINNNHSIKLDLDQLLKGSYLCSLINSNDKTLFTKRLIILRP